MGMAEPGEDLASQIVEFLGPREAEAGPYGRVGKILKAGKGAAMKKASSTAEIFRGKNLFGKTVSDIKIGKGDWRYIVYKDGTEQAVTKDVLNELAQEAGTAVKMMEFKSKDLGGQLAQAAKSLQFHKARQNMFATKQAKEEWLKVRNTHVKQMGMEPTPYVWVESEKMFLPEEYAKVLDDAGIVKIKKK